ncbi:hypothetical protein ILYODFUR_022257 [Ilyodon furcidens]|uniref:Uncharacterized protein n=1 Tax=Ilyodon furcidens TaxID=33524 RepID=A0ABV0V6U6_9TELE
MEEAGIENGWMFISLCSLLLKKGESPHPQCRKEEGTHCLSQEGAAATQKLSMHIITDVFYSAHSLINLRTSKADSIMTQQQHISSSFLPACLSQTDGKPGLCTSVNHINWTIILF